MKQSSDKIKGEYIKKRGGWWIKGDTEPEIGDSAIKAAINELTKPVFLVDVDGRIGVGRNGTLIIGDRISPESEGYPLCAYSPAYHPERFGDLYFKKAHNLRYAYIFGAMANGITSVEMVEKAARVGMLGFFGSAGLAVDEIEAAINRLQQRIKDLPFGFNLIFSPNEPELEASVVRLYLKKGIRLVSASAYMDLTLPIVYFRVKGIHLDNKGDIVCPNSIIAKVSRVEVAEKFFSPPPEKLLTQLVGMKMINDQEAALARKIPMASDITAEADSGGHTDNRPALSLLPTMLSLRDELFEKYSYSRPLCVGLGGGIATPDSTAAAFAMGAAFVLTGSINQSCIEAGTSDTVRQMLAETRQADIAMAPAGDMFEMGAKVQVLKRGTMFPLRAAKLYDLYSNYERFDDIDDKDKLILERDYFRCSFQEQWLRTKNFFAKRDPRQIDRAKRDPRHKMALAFRSYLGLSSKWAITGNPDRKIDYQIWCGPSMSAFNQWVKGSFLEKSENRESIVIAMNLLFGAAVRTRINWLHSWGVIFPARVCKFAPMELSEILNLLEQESVTN